MFAFCVVLYYRVLSRAMVDAELALIVDTACTTDSVSQDISKVVQCIQNDPVYESNESVSQALSVLYSRLASGYLCTGKTHQCIDTLKTALFYCAGDPVIHYNYSYALSKSNGSLDLSATHSKIGIALCGSTPKLSWLKANCYCVLGSVYKSVKNWKLVHYYSKLGYACDKTNVDIICTLISSIVECSGTGYTGTNLVPDLFREAFSCAQAQQDNTKITMVYLTMGHYHSYIGQSIAATLDYTNALKFSPQCIQAYQNRLLMSLYSDSDSGVQHRNADRMFTDVYGAARLCETANFGVIVGLVFGDIIKNGTHPVSFFIHALLSECEQEKFKFKVIVYNESNSDIQWKVPQRKIRSLSTEAVRKIVAEDNVTVLIDLSGHTSMNRLDIFSIRSAPVQIGYLGYPFTTGLSQMDYRITDDFSDRDDRDDSLYTEKLIRFNDFPFLCYTNETICDESAVPVADSVLRIACFNRLCKISDSQVTFCAKLMDLAPNVSFVFKTKAFGCDSVKKEFLSRFPERHSSRVTLKCCNRDYKSHLEEYLDTDISIDTWAYSGTTTTCESLFMGVPVFALNHQTHVKRVSFSINHYSGLDAFNCDTKSELTRKIRSLAQYKLKEGRLPNEYIKSNVKSLFINGKVCDTPKWLTHFTNAIESAIRVVRVNHQSNTTQQV